MADNYGRQGSPLAPLVPHGVWARIWRDCEGASAAHRRVIPRRVCLGRVLNALAKKKMISHMVRKILSNRVCVNIYIETPFRPRGTSAATLAHWGFQRAERSRFQPNVEFPVERSNFRSNVRNSGRTFGKMKNKNWSLGLKAGFQNLSLKQHGSCEYEL